MSFKKYIFVLAIIKLVYMPIFALNNIFKQYAKSLSSHLPKPKPIDTNRYTPETYIQYLAEDEKKLFSKIIEGYCPIEHKECYELKQRIVQDLKEAAENLVKQPVIPAYRDPEISEEICKKMDTEFIRKGIHPDNVSLVIEDFENENNLAITIFSTETLQFTIKFNRNRLFITHHDRPYESSYKNICMEDVIFHEIVHVQYLHPLKSSYIQKAKDIGKDLIMFNKYKQKELYGLELKYYRLGEYLANIIPALEDYEIALIRMQQVCFFFTRNPDMTNGIEPSHRYMRDRLKEVIVMHKKNGATVHSAEPQR